MMHDYISGKTGLRAHVVVMGLACVGFCVADSLMRCIGMYAARVNILVSRIHRIQDSGT